MPAIWADVKLDLSRLDNLMASTQGIAERSAGEESAEIVRGCKRRSRRRTGKMQRGWSRARIGAGHRAGWRIYNSVSYTVYNEFGTTKMSAKPMLGPEMRAARRRFPARIKKYITLGTRYIISSQGETAGGVISENQF